MVFPAVTICNQNRINCCNLQKTIAACTANYTVCGFTSANDSHFDILNFMNEKCGNGQPPENQEGSNQEGSNQEGSNQEGTNQSDTPSKPGNRKKRSNYDS